VRIVLHIGYPKTGTTTLQRHVLSRHSGLHYLGKPYNEAMRQWEKGLLMLDSIFFDPLLGEYRHTIDRALGAAGGRPVMISQEGFVISTRYLGHDLGRTARRLKAVFEGDNRELAVAVCIRNQADLLLSYFHQLAKGDQKDFDRFLEEALDCRPGDLDPDTLVYPPDPDVRFLDALFYDRVLGYYASLFGQKNIRILLFEDFLADQAGYLGRLSEFVGIDPSETVALAKGKHERPSTKDGGTYWRENHYSSLAIKLMKPVAEMKRRTRLRNFSLADSWAGRATMQTLYLLDSRMAAPASAATLKLGANQKELINELYSVSNARLADTFGLPLAERGYPVKNAVERSGAP
jgi:hypothetical protein